MRSTLFLSSALLLWPFLVLALPLPSCLDLDLLPEDDGFSCEPYEPSPVLGWVLNEGTPRPKARSTEEVADANARPALRPRENIFEHDIIKSKGLMRRAVESALSTVGKEGPVGDSSAIRALKERWIVQEWEELEVVEPPDLSIDTDTEKRWTVSQDNWDITALAAEDGDSDSTPAEPAPDSQ